MTGSLTITPASDVEDCRALRPLVRAHITFERGAAVVPDDWERSTAHLLQRGELVLLTARVDGDPVGYASMTTDVETWTATTFAHLDCLFVLEEHRGAGIGRRLVLAVVDDARNRGCGELQWQTPHWNASAIRFSERLGATHTPKARFRLVLR